MIDCPVREIEDFLLSYLYPWFFFQDMSFYFLISWRFLLRPYVMLASNILFVCPLVKYRLSCVRDTFFFIFNSRETIAAIIGDIVVLYNPRIGLYWCCIFLKFCKMFSYLFS